MNNCMNIPLNFYQKFNGNYKKLLNFTKPDENTEQLIRNNLLITISTNFNNLDEYGEPHMWISSRPLADLCKFNAVIDQDLHLYSWILTELPGKLVEGLLTESLQQLELNVASLLISQWPLKKLAVKNIIPNQMLSKKVLTESLTEQINRSNLLDAFIKGLLTRRLNCQLEQIDFRGFEEDRRLSIELCRIPALWLTVEKRNNLKIFSHLSRVIKLKQFDYLNRYFKKIGHIYANVEGDFCKDQNFENVEILFDCHLMADEIAVGLCLASMTPFRFSCSKLWISELQDIYLPTSNLIQIFDPLKITNFQLELARLSVDNELQITSFQWLRSLRHLDTLSIPGSLLWQDHNTNTATPHSSLAIQSISSIKGLNQSIIYLRYLQKLNLSRCFLKHQLRLLLTGVSQPLCYLNLQDCSLALDDLEFLIYSWRPFPHIKELNLSRNNFSQMPDRILKALLARSVLCGRLEYFSLAYCSIPGESLCRCLRLIGKTIMSPLITPDRIFPPLPNMKFFPIHLNPTHTSHTPDSMISLRTLCLQSFTPPSTDLLHQLLYLSGQLPSLFRLQLLPDALYAFPGTNDAERLQYKKDLLESCRSYLRQLSRSDIVIS